MKKYQVLAGIHSEDGVLYGPKTAAGAVLESDRDLVALFPNKFRLLDAPAQDDEYELGSPVTDQFPGAADGGLLVFKAGRKYFVATNDEPDSPLNEKDLTSKAAVVEFLAEYI